jgi:hypothetical protein
VYATTTRSIHLIRSIGNAVYVASFCFVCVYAAIGALMP